MMALRGLRKEALYMEDYTLNYKIWVEKDKKKVFGDGPCKILKGIERNGSLRTAAMEMGMSYNQAWRLIKKLEDNLGFPLLEKKVGGRSGGGSVLTKNAKLLIIRYTRFKREAEGAIEKAFKEHFLCPLSQEGELAGEFFVPGK